MIVRIKIIWVITKGKKMSTLSYEPNWGGIDGVFQQVALIYHEEVYGTSRNFWKFQNWEYMY